MTKKNKIKDQNETIFFERRIPERKAPATRLKTTFSRTTKKALSQKKKKISEAKKKKFLQALKKALKAKRREINSTHFEKGKVFFRVVANNKKKVHFKPAPVRRVA